MYIQFSIKGNEHNGKTPLFKFSPVDDIVAVASGQTVKIIGSEQTPIDTFDTGSVVIDLSWSKDGSQLIVLSQNSHLAFIWKSKQKIVTKLTLDIEDALCIDQSKTSNMMAAASSQGHLMLYDSFTSQKQTISSKHTKRIVSLQFTHQSDHIVTLSPEALIVSNSKGETVGYLKQKSIGGYFVNRLTAVQIKGQEQLYDGIVVPVIFDAQYQKKIKSELQNLQGLYFVVINVDKQFLKLEEDPELKKKGIDSHDLITCLLPQSFGNAILNPNQPENDTVIDIKYVPGSSKNFSPNVVILYSSGQLQIVSLDHSRQEIGVPTAESKFKYFTVVGKRDAQYQHDYNTYSVMMNEFNAMYGTADMCSNPQFSGKVSGSVSPCTSMSMISLINESNAILVPDMKNVDLIDITQPSNNEQVYIDFSDGKNSLGELKNPPTNIQQSVSGQVCFICTSNGASMMVLTKNVSQSTTGGIDQIFALDSPQQANLNCIGQVVLNLSSPRSVQITKLIPCKYQQPVMIPFESEAQLPFEPTKMACSQQGFAIQSGQNIQWTRIKPDAQNKPLLSWTQATMQNISQLDMLEVDDVLLVAIKTTDGVVTVTAGGGLQKQVQLDGYRCQTMKTCGSFIYCLTERAILYTLCVEYDDDELSVNQIAKVQLASAFSGPPNIAQDQAGSNHLEVSPGGVSVIIHKLYSKCEVQAYLPADEILLDNIFGEDVCISRIIFDNTLIGLFLAFMNLSDQKDTVSVVEQAVCSLQFTVADKEGAAVVYKKVQLAKRDISQLPIMLSNCIPYQIANKYLQEMQPLPGIVNIHTSYQQLKQPEHLNEGIGQHFILESAPVLPIQNSIVKVILADNDSVQVQITAKYPEYRRIALPSQTLAFQKGCVELINYGFPHLALQFAIRVNNCSLIKMVGDCALRFIDFDTAKLAFNELAMRQLEPSFSIEDYQNLFVENKQQADYLLDFERVDFYKHLALPNMTHNNDPAAISMFIAKICAQERDVNTCMAYSLLLSCPDFERFPKRAEEVLDRAERLLLKSNKPGLALSFRVDSLDWNTASVLAKKISSPLVRAEILVQQSGELETRHQYQDAIDVCMGLLKQPGEAQPRIAELFNLPPHLQPMFIGIVSRCFCQLGKVQETKDLALPAKNDKGRFVPKPKDPMNVLQRTRLNYECGEILSQQKRFGDGAVFYEAAAQLASACFGRLNSEISKLSSGEISLYDIVYGEIAQKMFLFHLLPALKQKARENYTTVVSKQESDKYDIQLLRQIDKTLETDTKRVTTQALPTKLSDIISASDLTELEPSTVLSKSANSYIKGRQYENAEQLIEYVTDKNTIADLARVYMRDNPEKALALFKKAQKSIEIVECLLAMKKVQEAESAVKEVRGHLEKMVSQKLPGNEALILDLENEVRQSALLIAQFFKKASATKKAIFYFIMAEAYNEAFELAITTKNEELLIRFVTAKAPLEFLKKTAKYFATPDPDSAEKKPRNMQAAAKFLELSGSVDNAIKLLLNFGDGAADIDQAIDLLRNGRSMVDYVLKYLQGGQDGVKKNPVYIFKLYLALDRFAEAAKTAFVLAEREMDQARFNRARGLLINCMSRLKKANKNKVPQKFRQMLVLLYSVVSGREFAKMELHQQAGYCLYRASKVASSFQDQAVSILLSSCVECWRAGDMLKKYGYECAVTLLKEYGESIPEKYKKQVDTVVRRYRANAALKPETIKCCQCEAELPKTALECEECQAILPLDSATGVQMSLSDYCECPYCSWTCSRVGLYQIYTAEQIKNFETRCMMCTQVIDLNQVLLVDSTNYQLITGDMSWDEYDHRPLVVFEDSILARRRYEEWVKIWYADEVE